MGRVEKKFGRLLGEMVGKREFGKGIFKQIGYLKLWKVIVSSDHRYNLQIIENITEFFSTQFKNVNFPPIPVYHFC